MIRRLILTMLLLASYAAAQDVQTGTITAADAACTAQSCVYLDLPAQQVSACTVQVVGAFTGTIVVEKTADGTNFVSAGASITAPGATTYGLQAVSQCRARASALSAGTPAVTVRYSIAEGGTGGTGVSAPGQALVNNNNTVGGIDILGAGSALLSIDGVAAEGKIPVYVAANSQPEWGYAGLAPRSQAGANYTYKGDNASPATNNDRWVLTCRTHTSAMTDTLGQAIAPAFPANFPLGIKNCDPADSLTVNITTSTINITGTTATSVVLSPGDTLWATSDGTNWLGWLVKGTASGSSQYTLFVYHGNTNPGDNETRYAGAFPSVAAQTTYNNVKIEVPLTGTVTRWFLRCTVQGTLGTTEAPTHDLFLNGATGFGSTTGVLYSTAFPAPVVVSGLTQAVTTGDFLALRIVYPGFATNPTSVNCLGEVLVTVP